MNLNAVQEKARRGSELNINRSFSMVDDSMGERLSELVSAIIDQSPSEVCVMDIGCGTARALSECVKKLKQGVERVSGIGVDLNPIKRDEIDTKDIELVSADAQDLSVIGSETVDIGFSIATLQYVPDPLRVLFEVNRVLKPGGIFLWKEVSNPLEPTVMPGFETIIQQSPLMQPHFVLQEDLLVNHKPASMSLPPATTDFSLAATCKNLLNDHLDGCLSEQWYSLYSKASGKPQINTERARALLQFEYAKLAEGNMAKCFAENYAKIRDVPFSELLQIS